MSDRPENADRDQAGRFRPGRSGNPAGKPRGTRHRATSAAEALLEGETENLTRKAVELALAGDTTALKLCLDRVAPVRRGARLRLDLPAVETADDLLKALAAVIEAMGEGRISPDEAATVAGVLAAHRGTVEAVEFERRLRALEERLAKGSER